MTFCVPVGLTVGLSVSLILRVTASISVKCSD